MVVKRELSIVVVGWESSNAAVKWKAPIVMKWKHRIVMKWK